ncbi:Protein of unknown function [Gryllus bimaculatus]|nr:Protein of unknown function [Gryllus bimaculatus]
MSKVLEDNELAFVDCTTFAHKTESRDDLPSLHFSGAYNKRGRKAGFGSTVTDSAEDEPLQRARTVRASACARGRVRASVNVSVSVCGQGGTLARRKSQLRLGGGGMSRYSAEDLSAPMFVPDEPFSYSCLPISLRGSGLLARRMRRWGSAGSWMTLNVNEQELVSLAKAEHEHETEAS